MANSRTVEEGAEGGDGDDEVNHTKQSKAAAAATQRRLIAVRRGREALVRLAKVGEAIGAARKRAHTAVATTAPPLSHGELEEVYSEAFACVDMTMVQADAPLATLVPSAAASPALSQLKFIMKRCRAITSPYPPRHGAGAEAGHEAGDEVAAEDESSMLVEVDGPAVAGSNMVSALATPFSDAVEAVLLTMQEFLQSHRQNDSQGASTNATGSAASGLASESAIDAAGDRSNGDSNRDELELVDASSRAVEDLKQLGQRCERVCSKAKAVLTVLDLSRPVGALGDGSEMSVCLAAAADLGNLLCEVEHVMGVALSEVVAMTKATSKLHYVTLRLFR